MARSLEKLLRQYRHSAPQKGGPGGPGGGFGGPRSLESSSETATADFHLSKDSTGFTNVQAIR